MHTFTTVSDICEFVRTSNKDGLTVGFVPTMGALHEGHYSLIRRAKEENDITVCSIFVNPSQFNEKKDLVKYPKDLKADQEGLEQNSCDILFAPSVKEIYPQGSDYKVEIDLGGLDQKMEGKERPGHFEGVVQVVKRLLEIVDCDRLYMGQKDFQQFTIIQRMIDELKMDVELVVCPIKREEDGLAMSSRNVRLEPELRKKATILYRVLQQAKEWLEESRSPIEITNRAMEYLSINHFTPEYFDLVDGRNLDKVSSIEEHECIVACTAVWAGEVRLIDNLILKGNL